MAIITDHVATFLLFCGASSQLINHIGTNPSAYSPTVPYNQNSAGIYLDKNIAPPIDVKYGISIHDAVIAQYRTIVLNFFILLSRTRQYMNV